MSWPVPDDPVCCDDYLPCYCYALNFDDYDFITKEREELQREIENFEMASPTDKELYRRGKLRYADLARPTPPPVRTYPLYTWRRSDKIEDSIEKVCGEVSRCAPGNRNNVLSRAAFFMGKLVQGGMLDIQHAAYKLGQAARDAKLPLAEAATTVRLGLQAGMREEAKNPYVQRHTPVGRGTTRTAGPSY